MGKALIDLTGQRIGRLTVLQRGPQVGSERRVSWVCSCECGTTKVISSASLRSGRVQSCTCIREEQLIKRNSTHGARRTDIYRTWTAMKTRCSNPSSSNYRYYGGRGISVCKAWADSFEQFAADMGPRPAGKTIDRIDSDGNYEPGNCRWASQAEQYANRRPRSVYKHGAA